MSYSNETFWTAYGDVVIFLLIFAIIQFFLTLFVASDARHRDDSNVAGWTLVVLFFSILGWIACLDDLMEK